MFLINTKVKFSNLYLISLEYFLHNIPYVQPSSLHIQIQIT